MYTKSPSFGSVLAEQLFYTLVKTLLYFNRVSVLYGPKQAILPVG